MKLLSILQWKLKDCNYISTFDWQVARCQSDFITARIGKFVIVKHRTHCTTVSITDFCTSLHLFYGQ